MKKLNSRHFSFRLKPKARAGRSLISPVHVDLELDLLGSVQQDLNSILQDLERAILTPALKEEVVQRIENILQPLAHMYSWDIKIEGSDVKIDFDTRFFPPPLDFTE